MPKVRGNKPLMSIETADVLSFTPIAPAHENGDFIFSIVIQQASGGSYSGWAGDGWSNALTLNTGKGIVFLYKQATSSSETMPTVDSTLVGEWVAFTRAISGANASNFIHDIQYTYGPNESEHTVASITTTKANCLIIDFVAGGDIPTQSPGMMDAVLGPSIFGQAAVGCTTHSFQATAGLCPTINYYTKYARVLYTVKIAIEDDVSDSTIPPYTPADIPPCVIAHNLAGTSPIGFFGGSLWNPTTLIPSILGTSTVYQAFTQTTGAMNKADSCFRAGGGTNNVYNIAGFQFASPLDSLGRKAMCHFREERGIIRSIAENAFLFIAVSDNFQSWRAWTVSGSNSVPLADAWFSGTFDFENTTYMVDSGGTAWDGSDISAWGVAILKAGDSPIYNINQFVWQNEMLLVGGSDGHSIDLSGLVGISDGAGVLAIYDQRGLATGQYVALGPVRIGHPDYPLDFHADGQSIFFPASSNIEVRKGFNNVDTADVGLTLFVAVGKKNKFTNGSVIFEDGGYLRIHPDSTDAGVTDFGGMVVSGCTDPDFVDVGPMAGIIFVGCAEITGDGDFSGGCSFKRFPANAVRVTNQTELDRYKNSTFEGCETGVIIDVAGSISLDFDGHTYIDGTYHIEYTGTGTLTANMLNGSNATTYNASGGGTVDIVNAVSVTITVQDADGNALGTDARVYIEKVSDGTPIMSKSADGSGIATEVYNYDAPTPIVGWVREMSLTGTDYIPKDFSGTITAEGFSITVRLDEL